MSSVASTSQAGLSPQLLSMLNGTSSGSTLGAGAGGVPTSQSIQNEFLTLLTTQLKNQDPLSPMDSSQMTAQLAQISTVSGIEQLDATMKQMMTSNSALQTAQATGLIGHTVMGPASTFALPATGGTQLGASLTGPADTVTATVLDAHGNTVKTFKLGAQTNGVVSIPWDGTTDAGGTAAAGNYTLKLQASISGQAVTATPLVQGVVTAVTSSAAGISLDVNGVGSVALGAVAQIN